MTKTVEAKMIISAYDRTAGAFGPIMRRMKDMQGVSRQMAAVNTQMAAIQRQQVAMVGRQVIGALATINATMGISRQITQAMTEAMKLEKTFSSIGKTAGISAREAASLGLSLGDAASKTGRTVEDMLGGVQALVAAGNSAKEAFDLAPMMATVANATDATVDDIAKSTSALLQNLGVTSSQILETWDKISATTKAGSFEARDIAQYLPAVSASAAKLGVVGPQGAAKLAAALQVTRTATGDASSAANNLVNLMEKIWAPDTKRNIDKALGPQAWRGFQKSVKNGQDDLTAFVDMLEQATKGDLTKLPALMPDAQARSALTALIGKAQMYDDVLRSAMGAQGTIMKDAEEQAKLAASAFDRMSAAADTLMGRMGKRFNDTMAPSFDTAAKVMGTFTHADTLITDYQDEMEKRTGVRPSARDVAGRFMGRPLGSDGTPEGGREAARRAAANDAYNAAMFNLPDPTTAPDQMDARKALMAELAAKLADATARAEETAKSIGPTALPSLNAAALAERAKRRLEDEITAQLPRLSALDAGTFATPDEVMARGYGEYGRSRSAMPKARPDLPLPKQRPGYQPTTLPADPGLFMDGPTPETKVIYRSPPIDVSKQFEPPPLAEVERFLPRAPEAAVMPNMDASAFRFSAMDDAARQASAASAEIRTLYDEIGKANDAAANMGTAFGSADLGGAVSQSMAGGVEAIRAEGQRMETEAQATMNRIKAIFGQQINVNVKMNAPTGGLSSGLNRGSDVSGNGMAGSP